MVGAPGQFEFTMLRVPALDWAIAESILSCCSILFPRPSASTVVLARLVLATEAQIVFLTVM